MSPRPGVRLEYLVTLGLLAAGGVLGLIARSQPWGSADVASSFTVTSITVNGGDLAPLVSGAPFVALAAVVLVPAVRTVGRRIAGGVLAVLGVAMTVNVLVVSTSLADRVYRWIIRAPDVGEQVGTVSTSPAWAVVAVVSALLVLVAGVLVLLNGPRWPSMGARYERQASVGQPPGTTPATSDDSTPPSAAQAWDALDRGDDPTT